MMEARAADFRLDPTLREVRAAPVLVDGVNRRCGVLWVPACQPRHVTDEQKASL